MLGVWRLAWTNKTVINDAINEWRKHLHCELYPFIFEQLYEQLYLPDIW